MNAEIVQIVTNVISTVGFPIAVVIWLFYYQKTVLDEFRTQMTENTKVLHPEGCTVDASFIQETCVMCISCFLK